MRAAVAATRSVHATPPRHGPPLSASTTSKYEPLATVEYSTPSMSTRAVTSATVTTTADVFALV